MKNKFLYGAIILVILILILIFFGYKKGYRFQENFTLGKIGNLSLVIPLAQTNIFIDDEKIVTEKDNEILEIKLSPRNHTVIISREGYFPWKKDFKMESEGNIEFLPIFISDSPSGTIITKTDPEFWKIRNKIITDPLPTKENPRLSKDGLAKLWLEGNAVQIEISSTTKTIIQPDMAIRNLYFYKNRNDVIIFSVNNGVYAIEAEKRGTQNFMPVYKGVFPSFIEGDSNYIYVLDNGVLMQVVI